MLNDDLCIWTVSAGVGRGAVILEEHDLYLLEDFKASYDNERCITILHLGPCYIYGASGFHAFDERLLKRDADDDTESTYLTRMGRD